MHKTIAATIMSMALGASAAFAAAPASVPAVDNLSITVDGSRATVSMDILTAGMDIRSNQEYAITPVLKAADGSDSIVMPEIVVAGRNMWYKHLRANDLAPEQLVRASKKDNTPYAASVAAPGAWLDGALLSLNVTAGNCCDTRDSSTALGHMEYVAFAPVFNYVTPAPDTVKVRNVQGSAYVNFPVNRIELLPAYMNNPAELLKITGTIDSVKSDRDVSITSISIKGYASPEGPYANNVRLAKGRTETLRDYVARLYDFAPGFIRTAYEPEDWAGLRAYVASSDLASRAALLAIIDSDLAPDTKDARMRAEYPADYAFLLAEEFPWLRHSDYRIDYRVKSFTSLDDILRVLASDPGKLSLNEFYQAAKSMKPGSAEYDDVFETAVRLYPADPAANLNAANAAMARADYASAARYLDKAGETPSAIYARGILEALQGRYEQARPFFARAAKAKVADAPAALEAVENILANGTGYRFVAE